MDQTLEDHLLETFPILYRYADQEVATEELDKAPPLIFGIECDDGWFTLLESLSHTIETNINENEDCENVHAVQVKEKFGGLRFYTDHRPHGVTHAIRTAEKLARNTCEICGTTQGAQHHSKGGWKKTLCEPCALDWKDIGTEIEIWKFSEECHKCGDETSVVYPRGLGGDHGGTWETIGQTLAEKKYCDVERIFSGVQKQFVWGNTCESCDAYQGNYYVYQDAMELVDQAGGWYPLADFDCIDIIERDMK